MTTAPIDIQIEDIPGFLLWHDDAKSIPTIDKINAAITQYSNKFKSAPDVCKVNVDLDFKPKKVGRVKIVRDKHVQVNYFMVGVK